MINASQAWVLVAEDNAMNQLFIKNILDKCGMSCHIVENGLLATEHAQKHTYDLICMDIQMPVMNGKEAITLIRSTEGDNKDVPIIVLSALTSGTLREEVLALDINGYVTKPFKPTDFLTEISKYIEM